MSPEKKRRIARLQSLFAAAVGANAALNGELQRFADEYGPAVGAIIPAGTVTVAGKRHERKGRVYDPCTARMERNFPVIYAPVRPLRADGTDSFRLSFSVDVGLGEDK